MVVIEYENHIDQQNRIVFIFGNGLVGSAITLSLGTYSPTNTQSFKIDWSDFNLLKIQILNCFKSIKTCNINQIDWVWSAGKSGFFSTKDQTNEEYVFFKQFVDFICEENRDCFFEIPSYFHLISSAGGLFEGQINISSDSIVTPLRPYGELKLLQEKLIESHFPNSNIIYRLSSVFGVSLNNQRVGLISALIQNTLNCRMTSIQGVYDTKRDYVWVEDVAFFIADKIISGNLKTDSSIFLLASGKPTTIFEIIELIQKITNNKVLCNFDSTFQNSKQIVFLSNTIPENFRRTSIETSIRKIYLQTLMSHVYR